MELGIITNFSFPHVGGTEFVLHNISKMLINNYNYQVNVFSFSTKKELTIDKVNIIPCKKGIYLIEQLNKMDHIFCYSDSFWEFKTLINRINEIKPKITIALVGMYHLLADKALFNKFKSNLDKINVITHSDNYQDYNICQKEGITVTVIPNGVNINEFDNNYINLRDKYNIKEKNILLSVGNFFFGKNQELMADIGKELARRRNDFIILMIYNSIQYPYAIRFLNHCKLKFKNSGCKYLFLQDLSREDVISAYNSSDLFIFPSKKEVAPLVILESMAAGLSWISMDVGNVKELCGGEIINSLKCDNKGYKVVDRNIINNYVNNIDKLLNNKELREEHGKNGRKLIEKKYNWENIVPLYDEIFKNA